MIFHNPDRLDGTARDNPRDNPREAQECPDVDLNDYDLIVVNTSGGKDSMALMVMLDLWAREAGLQDRLVAVHADLGEVEWPCTKEAAQLQAQKLGMPFVVVHARKDDEDGPHENTLLLNTVRRREEVQLPGIRALERLVKRGKSVRFPVDDEGKVSWRFDEDGNPATGGRSTRAVSVEEMRDQLAKKKATPPWPGDGPARWCTSDLKRGPISRVAKALAARRGATEARPLRVLSCLGVRSEESSVREKMPWWEHDARSSTRTVKIDLWRPIKHFTADDHVWPLIEADAVARGYTWHYAYNLGMSRVSCVFCFYAPARTHVVAGYYNPDLLRQYVEVEERVGFGLKRSTATEGKDSTARALRQLATAAEKAGRATVRFPVGSTGEPLWQRARKAEGLVVPVSGREDARDVGVDELRTRAQELASTGWLRDDVLPLVEKALASGQPPRPPVDEWKGGGGA